MHFGQSVLAQLVEQLTVNQRVAGSSPADGAMIRAHGFFVGPLSFCPFVHRPVARPPLSPAKRIQASPSWTTCRASLTERSSLHCWSAGIFLKLSARPARVLLRIVKIPSGVVGSVVISSQQTGRPARLAKERRWR